MSVASPSPVRDFQPRHPHRLNIVNLHRIAAPPSSPTAHYAGLGELSPTFDASFASSMSISSDSPAHPSPIAGSSQRPLAVSSSPYMMETSPQPPAATLSTLTLPPSAFSRAAQSDRQRIGPSFGSVIAPSLTRTSTSKSKSPLAGKDYPFLKNLFQDASNRPRAPSPVPSFAFPTVASKEGPSQTNRPPLQHFATVPPSQAEMKLSGKGRSPFQITYDSPFTGQAALEEGEDEASHVAAVPTKPLGIRPSLPVEWSSFAEIEPPRRSSSPLPLGQNERRTGSQGGSSPLGMDVDMSSPPPQSGPVGLSALHAMSPPRPGTQHRSVSDSGVMPHSHPLDLEQESPTRSRTRPASSDGSGASDRLADFFADDLSPMPQSRKRFLEQEMSPTPIAPVSNLNLINIGGGAGAAVARRPFEKAISTNCIRRRTSSNSLNAVRRPTLGPSSLTLGNGGGSFLSNMTTASTTDSVNAGFKRQAQAFNGKPAVQKTIRRALSVADAAFPMAPGLTLRDTNIPDSSYRASMGDAPFDGYFPPMAAGMKREKGNLNSNSVDLRSTCFAAVSPADVNDENMAVASSKSPITGFRSQEAKGKALPCFGVKEDGLMRISPTTMNNLQLGCYSKEVSHYLIIDCRFSYEYEGGHIDGAVNLSTTADVEQTLLGMENLPSPSTSESGCKQGKTVLIFHCEFSAKRAPTSAKHLRSKDRLMNIGDYPNIHYPEVYVLQGGYADYFKKFPERCEGGYLSMDDPEHNAKRSIDLHAFRQQKRQFSRASSFTFGQAQHASALLQAQPALRVRPPLRPTSSSSGVVSGVAEKSSTTSSSSSSSSSTSLSSTSTTSFVFPGSKKLLDSSNRGMCITEEEQDHGHDQDPDSSFGTNAGSSPGGAGESPCPSSFKIGRHSLKLGKEFGVGRRTMERAQTSSTLMFQR